MSPAADEPDATGSDAPGRDRDAGDATADDPALEDHARAGIEHLQAAARELIQASRAVLDVAEELVADPETARSVLGALGNLAQAAARGAGRSGSQDDDDGGPPKVRRIDVE